MACLLPSPRSKGKRRRSLARLAALRPPGVAASRDTASTSFILTATMDLISSNVPLRWKALIDGARGSTDNPMKCRCFVLSASLVTIVQALLLYPRFCVAESARARDIHRERARASGASVCYRVYLGVFLPGEKVGQTKGAGAFGHI